LVVTCFCQVVVAQRESTLAVVIDTSNIVNKEVLLKNAMLNPAYGNAFDINKNVDFNPTSSQYKSSIKRGNYSYEYYDQSKANKLKQQSRYHSTSASR
jgi:hypothetical protein